MSKDGVRPRYGGSKTRTGCITCKLRHVKCDETKPRCSRCVKAGRVCEGYHAPTKARSSDQLRIVHYVAPNSRSVSPFPESDAREIRALEYFKLVTAVQLAGPFSPDLWARDMLRIAYHQPPVHHALIALGTVHEEFTSPSSTHDFSDYASREYGKAVQKIINLTDSTSSHGIETTLATCVLFSCLESLRGHYHSSLSHIMSGLNILEEEERQQRHADLSCIPRELLVSLFRRLDSQRMELGGAGGIQGTMLSMTFRPSFPETFLSIDDAWFAFDMINYDFLQLQYCAEAAAEDQSKLSVHWSSLVAQQAVLEVQRQTWENAYHRMLDRGGLTNDSKRTRAMILLDMANTTRHIMLNVDLIEPESDFDKHLGLFSRIVDDAEELHQRDCQQSSRQMRENSASRTPPDASPRPPRLLPEPEREPTPIFTLSLGCVNILYLTASRCRNRAIRHRALNLLRKFNRREGLWDSNIAAKVAESVIAIEEEKTLDSLRSLSLGSNNIKVPQLDEVVIPYENRVKTIDLRFGPEARGKVMYSLEYVTRNSEGSAMPSAMDTSGMGELLEW